MRNYHSAYALLAGLTASAVYRLKNTWAVRSTRSEPSRSRSCSRTDILVACGQRSPCDAESRAGLDEVHQQLQATACRDRDRRAAVPTVHWHVPHGSDLHRQRQQQPHRAAKGARQHGQVLPNGGDHLDGRGLHRTPYHFTVNPVISQFLFSVQYEEDQERLHNQSLACEAGVARSGTVVEKPVT